MHGAGAYFGHWQEKMFRIKWVSLPPPQLSSFSTTVLNVLEKVEPKRFRGQTFENQPSKEIM